MANIKLTGIKQLEKNLMKLERIAGSKSNSSRAINGSLTAGLNVIKKDLKRKLPSDTGNLKRSLKIKSIKTKNKSYFGKILGFQERARKFKDKTGQEKNINDGYYSAFLEEGTKKGIKKGNYMLKSYEAKKKQVVTAVLNRLSKIINREIKKIKVR